MHTRAWPFPFALALALTLAACPDLGSGRADGSTTPPGDASTTISGDTGQPGALDGSAAQADTGSVLGTDGGTTPGADAQQVSSDADLPLDPWVVFSLADSTAPKKPSVLVNGDFEAGSASWQAYLGGYTAAPGEGRGGSGALKIVRPAGAAQGSGASQDVTLNQPAAKPLYFSGWVKADAVTGEADRDFAIYLDIQYVTTATDPVNGCDPATEAPCALYGQSTTPAFDTGTHDWQFREGFALPAHPIKSLSFYFLFRGGHEGTAWIDDFTLSELTADVLSFDGQLVSAAKPAAPYTGGTPLDLATTDGLSLTTWSRGGAIASAKLDGADVFAPAFDWAGGLFVHEAGTKDFIAPGGVVTREGGALVHHGAIPALSLELSATYVAEADRIRAILWARDTSGNDRPLTVYWALPASFSAGTSWGEDPRRVRPATGAAELFNTTRFWFDELGATGQFSRYPFGTVFDAAGGLALGYPADQPRIARLAYQPHTRQLYLALDVGLTSATTLMPGAASTEIVLYRTRHSRAADGFRSALAGFQSRHASHFARRIPTDREGIWNAFEDLSTIQNGAGESIDDFHFGIHESSESDVAFDDAHGILTFRYLTEPGSTWLQIPDSAGVDPADYAQTVAYLDGLYASGTASQKRMAEKTLSSAIFDPLQRYLYEPFAAGPPWCSGKCALFYLSPLPGIAEPPYTLDQASYSWNDAAKAVYTTTPGLDGDYLDSFTMSATTLNYRRSHLKAAQVPPTWAHEAPHAVGMPVIFSTVEFARLVKRELPAGKYFIANGGLLGIPFGADLLDFTGQETDWVQDVGGTWTLVPQDDRMLTYYRAMSGQRPYGFLMNTDFAHFSNAMVEQYMRVCLFYGIYPSMFSANASTNRYFSDPALYNRDRPLFKKYVPLVQAVSKAGWEPLSGAWTSDPAVYVERWGKGPGALYLTLRNTGAAAATVTIELDRTALGLGATATTVRSRLQGAADVQLAASGSSISVTIPAGDVELLEIGP